MSVAIVAMVNHSAIEDAHNQNGPTVDAECGITNDANSTKHTVSLSTLLKKNFKHRIRLLLIFPILWLFRIFVDLHDKCSIIEIYKS